MLGHGREDWRSNKITFLSTSLWLPPWPCVKLCKLLIINEVLGINSPLVSKTAQVKTRQKKAPTWTE